MSINDSKSRQKIFEKIDIRKSPGIFIAFLYISFKFLHFFGLYFHDVNFDHCDDGKPDEDWNCQANSFLRVWINKLQYPLSYPGERMATERGEYYYAAIHFISAMWQLAYVPWPLVHWGTLLDMLEISN